MSKSIDAIFLSNLKQDLKDSKYTPMEADILFRDILIDMANKKKSSVIKFHELYDVHMYIKDECKKINPDKKKTNLC